MTDVWPRRNLGQGENWGRNVERRLDRLNRTGTIQGQTQGGFGRLSVSTADSLSTFIARVRDVATSYPRPFTQSSSSSGFGFGSGWQTVASVSIANPGGFSRVAIDAVGSCTSYQQGAPIVKFIWPFSLDYVTSEYGARPPLPFHNGIDFSYGGIEGTAIPAAHDGMVILNAYYSDWGNYMRVDCSPLTGVPNSWTGYAHMNSPGIYGAGTTVSRGQTIGYVGNTGESYGAHLHFETATNDSRMNPRDFMNMFGGNSTVGLQKVTARIVINGSSSPEFEPFRGDDIPRSQLNIPIWGESISGNDPSVSVQLQMRCNANSVPADSRNMGALTVKGSFER